MKRLEVRILTDDQAGGPTKRIVVQNPSRGGGGHPGAVLKVGDLKLILAACENPSVETISLTFGDA